MVLPVKWGWGGIWMGYYPATENDVNEYREAMNNPSAGVDEGTLVGRYDRNYRVAGKPSPMGGEGSKTYEYQNVADEVTFTPAQPGKWWVIDSGSYRRSFSREPCHRVYPDPQDESYWDTVAGPKPMSVAGAVVKFGGSLVWSDELARYQMLDADGMPIDYVRIKSD